MMDLPASVDCGAPEHLGHLHAPALPCCALLRVLHLDWRWLFPPQPAHTSGSCRLVKRPPHCMQKEAALFRGPGFCSMSPAFIIRS